MKLAYFFWFIILFSSLVSAEVRIVNFNSENQISEFAAQTYQSQSFEDNNDDLFNILSSEGYEDKDKLTEYESRVKLKAVDFAKELRSFFSQAINITKNIETSTTLIEALEAMKGLETSFVCKSCKTFVTDLGKIAKSHIILKILDDFSYHACSLFVNKTVCSEIVATYSEIIASSLWRKEFNATFTCGQLHICPRDYHRKTLTEYVKEVLHDKPDVPFPSPTKRDSYKVLHLTDVHIDFDYLEGTNAACNEPLCCHAENGGAPSPSKAAKYWGTVGKCDLPPRTFDEFMRFASEEQDIDMIIWTGDSTAHNIWHQSIANQTWNTYYITEALQKYFPNTPIYPMFGNHEIYPADQYDFFNHTTDWLITKLADIWKGWLGEEAYETFKTNSYYSHYNEEYDLRIIALDTQTCDSMDFYLLLNDTDPLGQLKWLRNELYKAENNKESVFIIGHIPPGEAYCDSDWSARYRALIDRFGYLIRGQFFGHTHADQVEVVTSYENNSTVGIIYISPSLTTFTSLNPSFRVYEVDTDTNVLVNYEQFRLNLTKWNQQTTGPLEWDIAYNFLDEFNLSDISPITVHNFVENLKINGTMMSKYAFNLRAGSKPLQKISAKNTRQYYCMAKHSVYESAVKCMGFDAGIVSAFYIVMQYLPGPWYGLIRQC